MLQSRELMEEFRGLTKLEVPERKLISFVFFGLPELERNLLLDPPLAQRVAVRVELAPFDRKSTEAYIKHRLRLAGAQRMLFSRQALDELHQDAGGIPRPQTPRRRASAGDWSLASIDAMLAGLQEA